MITSGIVTVFVSDMDRAVKFYTELLGLELQYRFGNHWASVKAPGGLVIGLHPASQANPSGKQGSITIGFSLDEPLEASVERLMKKGVNFTGAIMDDKEVRFAYFSDADGNAMYLNEVKQDWKKYAPGNTAAA
jgi:predicted enzyme related to lactoylglutathione lyase